MLLWNKSGRPQCISPTLALQVEGSKSNSPRPPLELMEGNKPRESTVPVPAPGQAQPGLCPHFCCFLLWDLLAWPVEHTRQSEIAEVMVMVASQDKSCEGNEDWMFFLWRRCFGPALSGREERLHIPFSCVLCWSNWMGFSCCWCLSKRHCHAPASALEKQWWYRRLGAGWEHPDGCDTALEALLVVVLDWGSWLTPDKSKTEKMRKRKVLEIQHQHHMLWPWWKKMNSLKRADCPPWTPARRRPQRRSSGNSECSVSPGQKRQESSAPTQRESISAEGKTMSTKETGYVKKWRSGQWQALGYQHGCRRQRKR